MGPRGIPFHTGFLRHLLSGRPAPFFVFSESGGSILKGSLCSAVSCPPNAEGLPGCQGPDLKTKAIWEVTAGSLSDHPLHQQLMSVQRGVKFQGETKASKTRRSASLPGAVGARAGLAKD